MKKYKLEFVLEANHMAPLADLKTRVEDVIEEDSMYAKARVLSTVLILVEE